MIRMRWSRLAAAIAGRVAGLAVMGQLVAGAALAAAGGEGGGHPWRDLGWKTVNFLILAWLLWRFARKPLAAMLRSAAGEAQKALVTRQESAQKAEAELAAQRERIANLEAELQRLLGEASEEARREHARFVAEARTQAQRLKTATGLQVEQEFSKARKELQIELARETVRLAEAMIRQRMDDAGRQRFVALAIAQLEAGT